MHRYKHWPWLEVEGTDYGTPWRWILQLDLETEKCPRVTRRIDSPGLYLYWSINRGGREGERCLYSTIKWLTLLGSWSPHAGKPISFPPPQRFLLYNTSKHLDSPKPADSLIRSIGGLKNSQNVLLMPKAMKGPTRLQTPLQFPYCYCKIFTMHSNKWWVISPKPCSSNLGLDGGEGRQ